MIVRFTEGRTAGALEAAAYEQLESFDPEHHDKWAIDITASEEILTSAGAVAGWKADVVADNAG